HAEYLARLQDRNDERLRQFVLQRGGGDLRIDLHVTQRLRAQQLEHARIEREVVDDDEAAELLHRVDEALHLLAALHAGKLGDLEPDVLGGHVRVLEPLGDALRERRIFQRAYREVHGKARGFGIPDFLAVLTEPAQQALDDERIERGAFVALGRLREERGRHFIAAGIAPRAGEHFVAARAAARAQLDQLLHDEHEIAGRVRGGHRLGRRRARSRRQHRLVRIRNLQFGEWAGVLDQHRLIVGRLRGFALRRGLRGRRRARRFDGRGRAYRG